MQLVLDGGDAVSIAWQILPYALLTFGEVLVSATGLEFAYSQAPPAMKGVIMSFWSLSVTVGNLWVLLVNAGVRNDAVTRRIAATGLRRRRRSRCSSSPPSRSRRRRRSAGMRGAIRWSTTIDASNEAAPDQPRLARRRCLTRSRRRIADPAAARRRPARPKPPLTSKLPPVAGCNGSASGWPMVPSTV